MTKTTKTIAILGLIGKGSIYLITGVLTLLAALNMGGNTSGKKQALKFLEGQPFGYVLLSLLAIGLICYAIWRFIQSIKDPENIGNDAKGKVKRVAFFIGAIVYIAFAFLAIQQIFSSSSGGSKKGLVSTLGPNTVAVILIVIGIVLAGKAIFHFIKAFKGKFLDKYRINEPKLRKFMKAAGYFGFYARAAVVGIISFFFLKAGFYSNSNKIKGTQEAFSFLRDSSYGTILMGVTAAGLAAYGIFILMLSRYRKFED